jgi:hypothetical protein
MLFRILKSLKFSKSNIHPNFRREFQIKFNQSVLLIGSVCPSYFDAMQDVPFYIYLGFQRHISFCSWCGHLYHCLFFFKKCR